MRLHPRHRIDIRLGDLAFAAGRTVRPARGPDLASAVERSWSPDGHALACLSVRSGFDLLLSVLDLPAGSEVLVSAVTIADMARIITGHGLVAVPVDLDPATLGPRLDLLERLRTDRTRGVLVAHLFGGRLDVGPVAAFALKYGLLLLEDCAQSFCSPADKGYPLADASFFSFGPIKTATALGGALVRVRDRDVLSRMRRLQASWPAQDRLSFGRRVARMGLLVLLQHPVPYGLVAAAAGRVGRPIDELVRGSARSFPAARDFRRRPSAPLLALLHRRLQTYDGQRLSARAARGEHIARALGSAVDLPAMAQPFRSHWLFPVGVDDPQALVARLRAEGFDASTATSALVALPAPVGRPEAEPVLARRMLERTVFLPTYPELPETDLTRLLALLRSPP